MSTPLHQIREAATTHAKTPGEERALIFVVLGILGVAFFVTLLIIFGVLLPGAVWLWRAVL